MKAHTQTFKENLTTLGKEINAKVIYTIDGVETELDGDTLGSVTPHYEGNILKSVMKQVDIVSDVDIPIGTIINVQFGMRYDTDEYEYIDYGNYIVHSSEKQEDTNNYKIIAYDKMLYAMKDYEELEIEYPITIKNYIIAICNEIGLEFANSNDIFANYDKEITQDLYKDLGYTYRDVLDQLAQVTASTICINKDDQLEIRYINDSINESEEVEGQEFEITDNDADVVKIQELEGKIEQGVLPSEYQQVEYIESSGTQYIDTGFKSNSNTRVVIDFSQTNTNARFIFGARSSNWQVDQYCFLSASGTNFRTDYGANQLNMTRTAGTRYTMDKNKNANVLYENGTAVYNVNATAQTFNANLNMYIFDINNNGVASSSGSTMKLYSCKIYDNGTLVRDYIPCYKISNNTIGLYDLVNDVFYTNKGTGTFTKGSNVPTPNYPQNIEVVTGNQIVDIHSKNLCNIVLDSSISSTILYKTYTLKPNTQYTISTNTFLTSDYVANIFAEAGTSLTPSTANNGVNGSRTITSDNNGNITIGYRNYINTLDYSSGNYYVQIEKGTQATSYEPYKGNTYEVNLGKNLFNSTTWRKTVSSGGYPLPNNGYSTIISSGINNIEFSTSAYGGVESDFIKVNENETYTLSFNSTNKPNRLFITQYDSSKNRVSTLNYTGVANVDTTTITTTQKGYIAIGFNNTSVSSTNFVINDIQVEKSNQATSYSPYFEPIQLGEIGNYKDEIKQSEGKNLFNGEIKNIAFGSAGSSNYILVDNAYRGCYIPCEVGKTYSVSRLNNSNSRFRVMFSRHEPQAQVEVFGGTGNVNTYDSALKIENIVAPSEAKYLVVYLSNNSQDIPPIMINEGSSALPYEPYLPKGTWYLHKEIGKTTITANNSITYYAGQYWVGFPKPTNSIMYGANNFNRYKLYMERAYYSDNNNAIYSYQTGLGAYSMGIKCTSTDTIEVLKPLIDGSLMYYPLKTPTYTAITNDNYPELLKDLKALEKMKLLNGYTKITSDIPIKFSYATDYETINEDYIKNTRASFGEKYGPINSIVLSRSADTDNVYLQNQESIEKNGLCEVKIKDNQIMNDNNRSEFLPDLLEYLKGIEYYINDFESIGITYLDLLDRYKVVIGDKSYYCVMFNDEVDIHDGLNEIIYTEKPKEEVTDYKKATNEEKKDRQTYLMVDKQAQRIDAVVTTQGEFEDSLSSLTIDVDGIRSKVELNYDFVRETSGSNYVSVDDIQQEGIVELKITGTAISNGYLRLHITNNDPEYIDLPITTILKRNNDVFDTFSIEAIYNEETELYELHCFIDKKLDYIDNQIVTRSNTTNYLLNQNSSPITTEDNNNLLLEQYIEGKEDLGIINLPIQSGQHSFSIDGFSNLDYYLKYAVLNNVTSEFALKKHLISEINLTPEEATINAEKISLNGKTINLTSDDINIQSNNFKVDKDGNMECNEATMVNAKITGGELDITSTQDNPRVIIRDETDGDGNGIETYIHGSGMFVWDNETNDTYVTINTLGGFDNNNILQGYFALRSGEDNYTPTIEMIGEGGRIVAQYMELGYGNITLDGDTGHIECLSINPSSREEVKKNIEAFKNGLDIVKNVDIYMYNYKNEEDGVKKHIGFVIGDKYKYNKIITSSDNKGADLYSMVSVLWKAVQEQQIKIEQLEEEIKNGKKD